MPELPEVETIRRGLEPRLTGRRILRVELNRPDLRFPFPANFARRIKGRAILSVERRAKYLLFGLENGLVLLSHLGMSGRYGFAGEQQERHEGKHGHVVFHLDNGAKLIYSDPRRFGFMDLIEAGSQADNRFLRDLGIEPLGNQFSGPWLAQALRGRRSPIKAALLDQRIVAGLGNIYVCEALFRAGLSPRRLANTLAGARTERLADAVRAVLEAAIAAGGSSLRDFAAADGGLGYFQHGFDVYDREGEACKRCNKKIQRIVQSGRSTFFCPKCQR